MSWEDEFRNTLIGIYITCSILIIGTNLLLIFAILYSPVLRRAPRNALVVGICMADLLMGSFVTPMFTRSLVESTMWGCHTHLALQLISDHGLFFVVGWTLVTLNVLHVIQMRRRRRQREQMESSISTHNGTSHSSTSPPGSTQPSRPQTLPLSSAAPGSVTRGRGTRHPLRSQPSLSSFDPESSYFLPCPAACHPFLPPWAQIWALAILPWAAAMVTIIPLVLSMGTVTKFYSFREDVMCMLTMPRAALLTASFLSLYLPFYICVAALVTIIFCESRLDRRSQQEYHPTCHGDDGRNAVFEAEGVEEPEASSLSHRTEPDETEAETEADVSVQPHLSDGASHKSSQGDHPAPAASSEPLVDGETGRPESSPSCNPDTPEEPSSNDGENLFQPQRNRNERRSTSSFFAPEPESLLAPCLPNALYLVCYLPFLVHTWLHLSGVVTPDRLYGVVVFVLLARSFLMPIAWLAFSDIRREAAELWSVLKSYLLSLCSSNTPGVAGGLRSRMATSSASSVTFSRLRETQVV